MFRELKYVLAIADKGGVSKAAQSLYISQPSLSRYIQELESRLGVELFKRINNRLILTYAGEKYVETARQILELYGELENDLHEINEVLTGRLRVGTASLRMSYTIPLILKTFINKYPKVDIQLSEHPTKDLEATLLNGEIDLILVHGTDSHAKLTFLPFFEEEILLSVPQSHPLSTKGVPREGCGYPWLDLKSVNNQPFIMVGKHQRISDIAQRLFDEHRVTPQTVLYTQSVESAFRLTEVGIGMTLVPETHTKFCLTGTPPSLFSVGNPATRWSLGVAFRRDAYLPPSAREFIKTIQDLYPALPQEAELEPPKEEPDH